MSVSRYFNNNIKDIVPQPIRKILPAATDISHTLKLNERLDNLSFKYYKDPLLAWVIMCANPEFENEFDIPHGSVLTIPYPLQRVFDSWLQDNQI